MTTDAWMFRKISDYWDEQVTAIAAGAQRLALLAPEARQEAVTAIAAAVRRHAAALSDDWLAQAAFIMADDLYKAAAHLTVWNQSVADYLTASAGTFSTVLQERGYQLRYIIDNSFAPTPEGMALPLTWLPVWYAASGIQYLCPQMLASNIAQQAGEAYDYGKNATYTGGIRRIAHALAEKLLTERRHYVYLDTDASDAALEPVLAAPAPGTVLVFRTEPPVSGSCCSVTIVPRAGA